MADPAPPFFVFLQILPRYIVHFDDVTDDSAVGSVVATADVLPDDARRVVLWIDPNPAHNKQTIESMREELRELTVVCATSSAEARAWLQRNAAAVSRLTSGVFSALRVITNRYRKDDGDELAGAQWIGWMRAPEQRQLLPVPVLLFCSTEMLPRVNGLHNPSEGVLVSADYDAAIEFAAFRLSADPDGSKLLAGQVASVSALPTNASKRVLLIVGDAAVGTASTDAAPVRLPFCLHVRLWLELHLAALVSSGGKLNYELRMICAASIGCHPLSDLVRWLHTAAPLALRQVPVMVMCTAADQVASLSALHNPALAEFVMSDEKKIKQFAAFKSTPGSGGLRQRLGLR